jgi:hypothetical protein
MNKFARAFVFANRLFGAFTIASGGFILIVGALRVALDVSSSASCHPSPAMGTHVCVVEFRIFDHDGL